MNSFLKVIIGVAVLGAMGYFFVQSVKSTRSEPYTVARAHYEHDSLPWTTTTLDPESLRMYAALSAVNVS